MAGAGATWNIWFDEPACALGGDGPAIESIVRAFLGGGRSFESVVVVRGLLRGLREAPVG